MILIIWVFLPDEEGWQPYRPDDSSQLNSQSAIPENENAATIYNKLIAEYDANTFEFNIADQNACSWPIRKPWSRDDYPEIFQWLEGHRNIIAALDEAAQKDRCEFVISYKPFDVTMDRLPVMRKWAYLLVTAANNDLSEGRADAALEKCYSLMRISRHLNQQKSSLYIMVGMAIEGLAHGQFKNFIIEGNPSEEQLKFMEKSLNETEYNWTADLPKILEDDKRMAKEILTTFYEVNKDGKTRLSHDPYAPIRPMMKGISEDTEIKSRMSKSQAEKLQMISMEPPYWMKKIMKAGSILSWFFMPSTPQKAERIINAAYDKYYMMKTTDYDWSKKVNTFPAILTSFNFNYLINYSSKMAEKSYMGLHKIYLMKSAEKRGCRILIDLRRYKDLNGKWPENLEQIKNLESPETFTDPINNGSFVYKLTEDNFTLYSKGENGINENGQYNTKWDPNNLEIKTLEDDRLIWPERSKNKTKSAGAQNVQRE